jgi:hypothetical protein
VIDINRNNKFHPGALELLILLFNVGRVDKMAGELPPGTRSFREGLNGKSNH